MLPDIFHDGPGDSDLGVPVTSEQLARWQAIRQIRRRRRFWFWAVIGSLVMIIVTVSWAFSEYHNAGGWPTRGFSQSSWPRIANVWNDWIIWPAIVWVLATAGRPRPWISCWLSGGVSGGDERGEGRITA